MCNDKGWITLDSTNPYILGIMLYHFKSALKAAESDRLINSTFGSIELKAQ